MGEKRGLRGSQRREDERGMHENRAQGMTTTNVEAKQDAGCKPIPHGRGAAPEIRPSAPFRRRARGWRAGLKTHRRARPAGARGRIFQARRAILSAGLESAKPTPPRGAKRPRS